MGAYSSNLVDVREHSHHYQHQHRSGGKNSLWDGLQYLEGYLHSHSYADDRAGPHKSPSGKRYPCGGLGMSQRCRDPHFKGHSFGAHRSAVFRYQYDRRW